MKAMSLLCAKSIGLRESLSTEFQDVEKVFSRKSDVQPKLVAFDFERHRGVTGLTHIRIAAARRRIVGIDPGRALAQVLVFDRGVSEAFAKSAFVFSLPKKPTGAVAAKLKHKIQIGIRVWKAVTLVKVSVVAPAAEDGVQSRSQRHRGRGKKHSAKDDFQKLSQKEPPTF